MWHNSETGKYRELCFYSIESRGEYLLRLLTLDHDHFFIISGNKHTTDHVYYTTHNKMIVLIRTGPFSSESEPLTFILMWVSVKHLVFQINIERKNSASGRGGRSNLIWKRCSRWWTASGPDLTDETHSGSVGLKHGRVTSTLFVLMSQTISQINVICHDVTVAAPQTPPKQSHLVLRKQIRKSRPLDVIAVINMSEYAWKRCSAASEEGHCWPRSSRERDAETVQHFIKTWNES